MTTTVNNRQLPTRKRVDPYRITDIAGKPGNAPGYLDWSARHAGIDRLPFQGHGQRVGVLDTGADKDHVELQGQVTCSNFIRNTKQTPTWRDDCGHGCIQPTARILTSKLGLAPIEQFYDAVDSEVFVDTTGQHTKFIKSEPIYTLGKSDVFHRARITAVHKLRYSGKVFTVKFQHGQLLLTPWHPVYVQTSSRGTKSTIKRIRADELKSDSHRLLLHCGELNTVSTSYQSVQYNYKYKNSGVPDSTRVVTINEDMAWLLGFVLTDGHLCERPNNRGGYTRFLCVSQCERGKPLLDIAAKIIYDNIGYTARVIKVKDNYHELKVYGRGCVDLFKALGIPAGAKSKIVTLPTIIMTSPIDVILSFVGGCIDGDGCVDPDNSSKAGYIRLATSSVTFADTMALMLRSVGVWSSVTFNRGYDTSTFGACDMYHVCIPGYSSQLASKIRHPYKIPRLRTNGPRRNRSTYPILDIAESHYNGYLYDLTVDTTHNYLAEGVLVSNTFCTGEIVAAGVQLRGVAPLATAFSGRVLYGDSRDGMRDDIDADIADGVLGCINEGCGVISMSLGGPGASPVLRDALQQAVESGIIPVAAAGNERLEGSTYASYPAAYPTVISVASADKDNMPAWFSTMGTPDVPGKPEIAVAALEYYWGCLPGYSTYGRMTGTSMATPMVAGVALLWREARRKLADEGKVPFPQGSNVLAEFRQWLYRIAKDTNNNGWDPELGWGVLLLNPSDMPGA